MDDDGGWENAIELLTTTESKLLYLIDYIFKKKSISELTKKKLKKLLYKENIYMHSYIRELLKTKDLIKFINSLNSLASNESKDLNIDLANDHSKSAVHKALLRRLNEFQLERNENNNEDFSNIQGKNLIAKKRKKPSK